MLNRIISIKNVGRFKSCSAVGDVTFRRFTLIFAENGRGKTTLCAILRSLFTNSPAYIIGRKTLGNPERPEIQLLTDVGTIVFRNGVWNAAFPDIAVYDGTYVSENVFAGDVVDTGHRRNLYRVIIGAQGVTLAGRLNDLDTLIRDKTTDIRNNRTSLERYLPPGMTVETFIALPEDAHSDAKIAAKEQELQAVQRASQLQQRAGLAAIPLPVFPTAFAEVLAKTFANVSADAERRVGEHIALHQMQARGSDALVSTSRSIKCRREAKPGLAKGFGMWPVKNVLSAAKDWPQAWICFRLTRSSSVGNTTLCGMR